MAPGAPPLIFSSARRAAVRRRMRAKQQTATYLADDMVDDFKERLDFLRSETTNALVIGDWTYQFGSWLEGRGAKLTRYDTYGAFDEFAFDPEQPYPHSGFDFIACFSLLDTTNDLPGALIHLRQAAAPGGLLMASFVGAGSLEHLRAALLTADGDRPAPRLHPAVDVRAAGQLLQRAGWRDPVVDVRSLPVRFSSLESLVEDLRAQGLSNALARPGPALTRKQISSVKEQFGTGTVETFEILTLTGRR